jgi:pyruvate dehydrogenase E2 component (dihydrolipoamide acetyltransferase)
LAAGRGLKFQIMPISVVMPALEMAQETGKLISWLKKEGDTVAKGEPLLEVETDKAVMEVESPGDGVLAGVKVEAGAEVPVGRTIAWIVKAGESAPTEEVFIESGRKSAAHSSSAVSCPAPSPAPAAARKSRVSPKARRLAAEKGVDLSQVRGSGADGEVLAADILAVAESKQAASVSPSPSHAEGGSPIARLMAERTTQSWTTVPHFYVVRDLDATSLNAARQRYAADIEKSDSVKVTHTDLFVALVARVLAKHPKMNSSWAGNVVRANPDINISIAIAVEDGVVAPVIPHADKAVLGAIAVQRRDLAERARASKLRAGDLAGGTFTISNLGMLDVDSFTAIITPPQAAILAIGRISDRVIAVDGKPAIRPMVTLTLSSDHRVIDGARAAEFMRDLAGAIANPQQWLEGK